MPLRKEPSFGGRPRCACGHTEQWVFLLASVALGQLLDSGDYALSQVAGPSPHSPQLAGGA